MTEFFGSAAAVFGTESTSVQEQKDLTPSLICGSNLQASAEQRICAHEKVSTPEYVVEDYVALEESTSPQSTIVPQQNESSQATYTLGTKKITRRNPSMPRQARRR